MYVYKYCFKIINNCDETFEVTEIKYSHIFYHIELNKHVSFIVK